MATTETAKETKAATRATGSKPERRSLYPPGHRPTDDPYYLDDTLDAHPPLRRLFGGKPTPEAMEAAKRLAAKRGYPTPQSPRDNDGKRGRGTAAAAAPAANGAASDRPKRNGASRSAEKS